MASRLVRIAAILALAALLHGCGPANSLYSLYDSHDSVSDDRLLGSWQPVVTDPSASDKNERWIFSTPKTDQFYVFRLVTIGEKGGFAARARLVRLGNNLFVDFVGDAHDSDEAATTGSVIPFPVIATHMIGRVALEKDTLQLRFLKDDWVRKQVQAGTFSLASLSVDGDQIITAETGDLRKFMQAHADDEEALSESYSFVRAK